MNTPLSANGYVARFKKWLAQKAIETGALVVGGPCMILCLWAAIILLMQFVQWFQSGEWMSLPATEFFYHGQLEYPAGIGKFIPDLSTLEFSQWLQSPSSALGPHKLVAPILGWLSVPAFLVVIAGLYLWFWMFILSEIEKFKKST